MRWGNVLSCSYTASNVCHLSFGFFNLCYTATGYNSLFGDSHVKQYFSKDAYCAGVIRDLYFFGTTS